MYWFILSKKLFNLYFRITQYPNFIAEGPNYRNFCYLAFGFYFSCFLYILGKQILFGSDNERENELNPYHSFKSCQLRTKSLKPWNIMFGKYWWEDRKEVGPKFRTLAYYIIIQQKQFYCATIHLYSVQVWRRRGGG